jgi:hypothetical protein
VQDRLAGIAVVGVGPVEHQAEAGKTTLHVVARERVPERLEPAGVLPRPVDPFDEQRRCSGGVFPGRLASGCGSYTQPNIADWSKNPLKAI